MALALQHLTKAEFADRFWARCAALNGSSDRGDRVELHRLVWWLVRSVSAGDFTSNQVRISFNNAFGRSMSGGEWAVFATTRLQPMHDRYQAFIDEAAL